MKRIALCLGWLAAFGCAGTPKNADLTRMPSSANDTLLTCTTSDLSVLPYLYDGSDLAAVSQKAKSLRITVGQDQSTTAPLYEVNFDVADETGAYMNRPRNIRRIAFIEDTATHQVSLTYSPNRSTGRQEARPFNLFIDSTQTGKLSFLQIGSRQAPTTMTSFQCARTAIQTRVPAHVDLASVDDKTAIAYLAAYSAALPSFSHWEWSGQTVSRPSDLPANFDQQLMDRAQQTTVNEADFRKAVYMQQADTVAFADASARCTGVKLSSLREIRDYTGQTLGYEISARCTSIMATVTSQAKPTPYAMGFDHFYATPQRVLFTPNSKTSYSVQRQ